MFTVLCSGLALVAVLFLPLVLSETFVAHANGTRHPHARIAPPRVHHRQETPPQERRAA